MANLNTKENVGIRRDIPGLGARNYEPKGGAEYASNRENLEYLGTKYQVGTTIPFDVNGTSYSNDALMERYFNAGFINPLT